MKEAKPMLLSVLPEFEKDFCRDTIERYGYRYVVGIAMLNWEKLEKSST